MQHKGQGKDQRRQEGEARNEKWQKLTPSQQLQELDQRPGESKRQRAKLSKILEPT